MAVALLATPRLAPMPSPFPGVDPFVVAQEWDDFQTSFVVAMSEFLNRRIAPGYVARVEVREFTDQCASVGGQAVPVREKFLTIRRVPTREVVTHVDMLSPYNTRVGTTGHEAYREGREEILRSRSHLIELDLLRGGTRLPMASPLPPADYYAIVSRSGRRHRAEIYPWTIRDPLPTIPIPLLSDDPAVPLDLQEVFTAAYDRAIYGLSIDYSAPLDSPLKKEDEEWLSGVLADKRGD